MIYEGGDATIINAPDAGLLSGESLSLCIDPILNDHIIYKLIYAKEEQGHVSLAI